MNFRKFTLCMLSAFALFSSCRSDDDSGFVFVPADRTEQQVIDGDSLIGYLQTHYYNSSAFAMPGNYHVSDIIISESPEDEDGNLNTLLMDVVEMRTTTFMDVEYDYYILKLNQGGGDAPHFCDDVRVNYSGMLQNDVVFDSTANPINFDLLNLIQGWRLVMPEFNAAEDFMDNGDGTFSFNNYGLGMMFLPSGLAYFGSPPIGVTLYSNLIFKFELYQTEINDHDNDLVPSYLEDLDGDGNLFNNDTDNDGIPNFLDPDDDGDGVGTRFEDLDNDGDPTNDDSNGNGIPNYLDPTSTESNQN